MQLLAQAAAFLLVVVYVVGFLTLSLYHASFGISLQYSLFRPRVLSAGTIFIVLGALAMIAAAQTFNLWIFDDPSEKTRPSGMLREGLKRSAMSRYIASSSRVLFFLYFITFFSFIIARYLFVDGYEWEDKFGAWGLAMLTAGPAIGGITVIQKEKRPFFSFALTLLAILFVAFCLWRIHDAILIALMAWFCIGAFTAHSLQDLIVNPSKLKEVNWHWSLVWTVSILTLFATSIYPHMKSSLGGGAPVPATFQFVDNSVLDNVSRVKLWVIDETDVGFYVIRTRAEKKAIFIPRGFVKTIYFGE